MCVCNNYRTAGWIEPKKYKLRQVDKKTEDLACHNQPKPQQSDSLFARSDRPTRAQRAIPSRWWRTIKNLWFESLDATLNKLLYIAYIVQ